MPVAALSSRKREAILQRISEGTLKLETESGTCWIWEGAKCGNNRGKYGIFVIGGRTMNARRASYEASGKSPRLGNYSLISTCGDPLCVNPDHLVCTKIVKGGRRSSLE